MNSEDFFTAIFAKEIVGIIVMVVLGVLALGALLWLLVKVLFAAWFVTALWFDWWWVPTGFGLSYVVVPYLVWFVRNLPSISRNLASTVRNLHKSTLIGGAIRGGPANLHRGISGIAA